MTTSTVHGLNSLNDLSVEQETRDAASIRPVESSPPLCENRVNESLTKDEQVMTPVSTPPALSSGQGPFVDREKIQLYSYNSRSSRVPSTDVTGLADVELYIRGGQSSASVLHGPSESMVNHANLSHNHGQITVASSSQPVSFLADGSSAYYRKAPRGLPNTEEDFGDDISDSVMEKILEAPDYIVWHDEMRRVTIDDCDSLQSLGITYNNKVSYVKSIDGNCGLETEVFTLITDVDEIGCAYGKLHRGDWIRSVNGNALQSKDRMQTTHTIWRAIEQGELNFIVQRPKCFLPVDH